MLGFFKLRLNSSDLFANETHCSSNLQTLTQVTGMHKMSSLQTRAQYKELVSTLDCCKISVLRRRRRMFMQRLHSTSKYIIVNVRSNPGRSSREATSCGGSRHSVRGVI